MFNARHLQKAIATNLNTTAFTVRAAQPTKPVTDANGAIFDWGKGKAVPLRMQLFPYGLGANNDGFSIRIIGWACNPEETFWLPSIIGEFTCLMGNTIGFAGGLVLNTEFFCDTITPVAARTYDYKIAAGTGVNSDYQSCLVVNDTPSFIDMPTFGFPLIELQEDQTTNTPTMGCLIRGVDPDET